MPTSARGSRRPRARLCGRGILADPAPLSGHCAGGKCSWTQHLRSRLVYSDPDCEALILQCNISDIFPDAEIRLRCEEGEAEFSPYISLRDGSVVLGPEGLDLTRE